eukprot:CAMPEP_0206624552 /NCGR_PEP_ID=MMETSP0325_2-20121206/64203_1 /ASSEMBLY_ACC=CAM_ASM_000347 /TAXON_ID=2866 /ORGANISM="Crypthecodinium cohnii, Strain Seligo" /LENGTH=172 /DNA_ID=CAMNT_0054148557 /DNA_START=83 /DNA_END=598 /DNA_ORIENTATION=+
MTMVCHGIAPAPASAGACEDVEEHHQLRFSIDYEGTSCHLALAPGDSLYVGRTGICAVKLNDVGISTKHVKLTALRNSDGDHGLRLVAEDISRNGTLLRDPCPSESFGGSTTSAAGRQTRVMESKTPQELRDGEEIHLPARRPNPKAGDVKVHRLVVRLKRPCSPPQQQQQQ